MTVLYLDCFSGAACDMLLGALIDAGVPLADVRAALGSLAIGSDTVWTERVSRAGLSATKFCVRGEDEVVDAVHDHPHGHDRSHTQEPVTGHAHAEGDAGAQHHHRRGDTGGGVATTAPPARAREQPPHRTLRDIDCLIDGSALSQSGRRTAKELFARLGEAEAAVHGTSLEKVHLHEVGALDSIVDVVGTVFALETIGADRIVSSPLNLGSGSIRSAHGLYPVPGPATARLLQGAPVYAGPQRAELVTPTGALLVTHYAASFGSLPPMRLQRIGYGAGSRDFADTPNVLRVLLGDADGPTQSHSVVVLEAEIDDMNPQIFGVLMDRLLDDGALDVFYTSVQMKKNRPGTLLSVVAPPARREQLTAMIFRETTTIGVRHREMMRECLDRDTVPVQTPLGSIRVKVARRAGRTLNAAPEFEDCARIARERDVPLKDVQAAALKAFLDRTETDTTQQ